MSLINDAIKQANKANKDRASATPAPGTPPTAGMQTAELRSTPATGGSMTGMFLIAGIVLFVLLGGSLLFLGMRSSVVDESEAVSKAPSPAVAATPPANQITLAPEPAAASQPAPTTISKPPTQSPSTPPTLTTPPATAAPQATQATATAPAPEVPAKPAGPRPFPELKLQGIYFRIKDPSVMINGKTLMIGDLVADVTVLKIERKDVTVELDGQQKVLRLQ